MTRTANAARKTRTFAHKTAVKAGNNGYSPSSNVACETVVCKMQRVELG